MQNSDKNYFSFLYFKPYPVIPDSNSVVYFEAV